MLDQSRTAQMMRVRDLNAWYGESHVLHGINLDLREGEVITLLGRNGAGKTSTLRTIMGMIPRRRGSVLLGSEETINRNPRQIARMGVGYVPEERGIYASLTVRENLHLPPKVRDGGFTDPQIFELFPNLRERLNSFGSKLSGGEQQMLALGRILRTGAKLLLCDELTEGLAPVIIQQIGHTLQRLKREGFTIILVESNFRFTQSIADRHYIIEQGRVVDEVDNEMLESSLPRLNRYLGV